MPTAAVGIVLLKIIQNFDSFDPLFRDYRHVHYNVQRQIHILSQELQRIFERKSLVSLVFGCNIVCVRVKKVTTIMLFDKKIV